MRILSFLFILTLLASCSRQNIDFSTDSFSLSVNGNGQVVCFADSRSGRDYLPQQQTAPFISIRVAGRIHTPNAMESQDGGQVLRFRFDTAGVVLTLKAEVKASHLRFEVLDTEPFEKVEMVIWGPYPTSISKTIGETIGVVRDDDYAIGLQALNPKTLGGYPWTDNDCMPQIDIFEGGNYSDLSEEGKRYVLYRVEAAKPESFGSTLQAYCRNRLNDRIIENWDHEKFIAPAYDDGGVVGSKIALFGCPVDETLDYIGMIEMAEGLPHPMIAGEWGKKSQAASSSYMILDFGEEDLEKALAYTRKAGLNYLYHSGPFKTWGHFILNDQFPNGWPGLKNCVNKAGELGIFLGVHTLSNFITPNDAYVTPVPDTRLAKVGFTSLTKEIGTSETEIGIDDPSLFRSKASNIMRTVMIGQELVRYDRVSENSPWMLLGCARGAFGTTVSSHKTGAQVSLLADHAYKVFLSNADLSNEIGETIARLFNETGIRQVSFDGLEGNRSTGMGNYGEILMTNTWYENLDEDVKTHYIADASRTSHYFWHIYSRMNWGEPWYAGFRESQTEYRFKNQAYFQRNLMPGMLGWFLMTEKTSPEDIEWMLSKAAGYNAGFGFVCNYKSLEGNGKTGAILDLINRWETARMKQLFTPEVTEMLKAPGQEFHLEENDDGKLSLWPVQVGRLDYSGIERQPGETGWSTTEFDNPFESQPLQFVVVVPEHSIPGNLEISIDNKTVFRYEGIMNPGEILLYDGGDQLYLYSENWTLVKSFSAKPANLTIGEGTHLLGVKSEIKGTTLKIEFKTTGNPIEISRAHE